MRICPRCGLKYPNDQSRCFVDNATVAMNVDMELKVTPHASGATNIA